VRDRNYDYDRARRVAREWQQVAAYMLEGDYYPLTPYSAANDVWMAWQYDLPEKGEGVVQAFRRGECPEESVRVRLGGLRADSIYVLTNFDETTPGRATGRQLMEEGLPIKLRSKPDSAIIMYKIARQQTDNRTR
jgi:alpha-galactosidase